MSVFPNAKRLTKDYLEKLEAREASGSARHPYDILLDLAMGRDSKGNAQDIPLTVRHLSAVACLRCRLPVLSKAETQVDLQDNRAPQFPGRLEILQSLASASKEQLAAIFKGTKALQLTEGSQADDQHT
jgi:hypothetical protein